MRHFSWMLTAAAGTTLSLWLCPLAARADKPAESPATEAQELIEQAEKAAASGHADEAHRLLEEARQELKSSVPTHPHHAPAGSGQKSGHGASDVGVSIPQNSPGSYQKPDSGPGGPDPAKMKEMREKYQKVRELHQKLKELEDAGKTDEAQKVRDELQDMRKKLSDDYSKMRGGHGPGRGLGPGPGTGPGGPAAGGQAPEAFKKLMDLRKQIHDAEDAGDDAKADQLRQEAHEMMHKFREERMKHSGEEGEEGEGPRHRGPGGPAGPGPEGRPGGPPPGPPSFEGRFEGPGGKMLRSHGDDVLFLAIHGPNAKLRQLRMASSLLAAAGFPDEAKHVKDLADKLPKETAPATSNAKSTHKDRGPDDGYRGNGRPPGPPPRRGPAGPSSAGDQTQQRLDRLERQLHRLSEQLEKLSHDDDD